MKSSTRNAVGLVVAAGVLAVGAGMLAARPQRGEGGPVAANPEATKKLRERMAVVEEIAGLEWEAYRNGQNSLAAVLEARREALQAKLDVTTDRADRVEVLRQYVDLSTQMEEHVRRLVDSKNAARVDLLKATAARLRVEARLASAQLQAKGKQ